MRRATSFNAAQPATKRNFYPRSPCGERRHTPFAKNIAIVISIHALLAESDVGKAAGHHPPADFYPRSPCGERHFTTQAVSYLLDFYPRSPCGERHNGNFQAPNRKRFLSTLSLRRATYLLLLSVMYHKFLSTLSLRRATRGLRSSSPPASISIHALLAESDPGLSYPYCTRLCYFYPRSPCGERRLIVLRQSSRNQISIHALLAESDQHRDAPPRNGRLFLSTLSLRRATSTASSKATAAGNFYPRSPCGERPAGRLPSPGQARISIHALLAESDGSVFSKDGALTLFLSTLSLRRATICIASGISVYIEFLSTLSLRRATFGCDTSAATRTISIHALLAESDGVISRSILPQRKFLSTLSLRRATPRPSPSCHPVWDFYPRSPCGERPAAAIHQAGKQVISIHALLAESDWTCWWSASAPPGFLSTLSLRRAT